MNKSRKIKLVGKAKKAMVISLASLMMFQTCAASVSASNANAIIYDSVDNGEYEEFMSGAIKKMAGNIPVIGGYLDIFIDPILKKIFGTEDGVGEKLQEISSKLDSLSLQLQISTEQILKEDYARELNTFNNEITDIRDATSAYLKMIANIEKGNYSQAEKALRLATLFQLESGSTSEYINQIRNASTYIAGRNIDTSKVDPVFVKAFKLKCSESVFGGEAAERAGVYVNEVYQIMDAAYKVEAIAYDARLGLVNALFGKGATEGEYEALLQKYDKDPAKSKLLMAAKYGDDISDWTDAANAIKTTYDALYSMDNSDSVASKYNTMIGNYKYCYIKKCEYEKYANITFVPLSTTMNWTTFKKSGLIKKPASPDEYRKARERCVKDMNERFAASGLDENDVKTIMDHVDKNSSFYTYDHKPAEGYLALQNYGFNIYDLIDEAKWDYNLTWNEMAIPSVVMKATRPIVIGNSYGKDHDLESYVSGYDLNSKTYKSIYYSFYDWNAYVKGEDPSERTLLFFKKTDMPVNPFDRSSNADLAALIDNMYNAMIAGLTINDAAFEDENKVNDGSILITVEDGMISGEKEGEAWKVAEDGTIVLLTGEFRFEGKVENRNIQVMKDAAILSGTFENCEIAYEEGAVIGDEVELINTNVVNMDEEKAEDESIVLTAAEDGQVTGDQQGEAWETAADGTLLLLAGEFRFDGTVEDRNIQVMKDAAILSGTFEDSEIACEEGAVIGDEVELINTMILNLNDAENDQEEAEDGCVVLNAAEDGRITSDENDNEAWETAADGSIVVNEGYKVRFEGKVTDRNIINNGEIVDGTFENVHMQLTETGKLTGGRFENGEIAYLEGSAIGEKVELNNVSFVDLNNAEQLEENLFEENEGIEEWDDEIIEESDDDDDNGAILIDEDDDDDNGAILIDEDDDDEEIANGGDIEESWDAAVAEYNII